MPKIPCVHECVHLVRHGRLVAKLAHLNNGVTRVAAGLSSGELTPGLASAILRRIIAETASMREECGG